MGFWYPNLVPKVLFSVAMLSLALIDVPLTVTDCMPRGICTRLGTYNGSTASDR